MCPLLGFIVKPEGVEAVLLTHVSRGDLTGTLGIYGNNNCDHSLYSETIPAHFGPVISLTCDAPLIYLLYLN